ncbi:hypothetical protein PR048_010645, partial [Dryococelus australis]
MSKTSTTMLWNPQTCMLNTNWYYMPPSMHQELIHCGDVIKHAIVPIGLFSEEVRYRERRTRKICRLNVMEDEKFRSKLQNCFAIHWCVEEVKTTKKKKKIKMPY